MRNGFEKYKAVLVAFLQVKCFPKSFITIKDSNGGAHNILYSPKDTQKFEVKITQVDEIPQENNKLSTNEVKNVLLSEIASKLKYRVICSGKIYVVIKGYAMKIELVKNKMV